MARFDLKVIKGTEDIVIKSLPDNLNYKVDPRPNVTLISFDSSSDISTFKNLRTALSITNQTTSLKLYSREWRIKKVAAGINPSLACILCEIAEILPTDSVLDPFCGAGIIPLSALHYYCARVAIASDVSSYATACTRTNSEQLHLEPNKLIIIKSGISELSLGPKSVDKIISNPPFGIRTGTHDSNRSIYSDFASQSSLWLRSGGKIVLLSQEVSLVKETFGERFTLAKDYPIFHHGLRPHIMVYVR